MSKPFTLIFSLLISVTFANAQSFRFAWLSDTHVGSTTGAEDLRRSVQDINGLDSIDFVVISGDITELGWNEQFALAKSILDSLRIPWFVEPGNHDTKWSESGCTAFRKTFGYDRFVFDHDGFRFFGIHEGPIMRMGDGHFAPEDLRWLDSVLTATGPKTPVIFVTHYPLDNQLDNWYDAIDRLKRVNTQAVLVGHGHANVRENFEGIPGTMGRSNLRARKAVGGYNLVTVRNDTMFFAERNPGIGTLPPWRTIRLEKHDYASDTTRYPRPAYTVNDEFPGVKTLWRADAHYTIASAPAVWNGNVYVGDSHGDLNCYALGNGSLRWTFSAGSTIYSSPAAADGDVVFGCSNDTIYCLNAATGARNWAVGTGASVVAAPLIENGTVYCGGSDGKFRAIDLRDGRVKWEFGGIEAFVECRPLLYDGLVIFGAWDTYLYALNASDGSLAWKWSNGNPGDLFSPAACWPVASNGTIFIVAPDRVMTALDAKSGAVRWRSSRYEVREAIGISNDGSTVYAKTMNDTLAAFDTKSATQSLKWATDLHTGYDIDPSMPEEKDGTVFASTKNGVVAALNAATGKRLWEHKIGNTIVNTLAPIDGRRVLATDFDGKIELLEGP